MLLVTAVGAIALVTGCATDKKTADDTKKTPSAAQEEYVTVNSMGSWIPRKVKKKDDLIGDKTGVASAEALQKVQNMGAANTAKEPGAR